MSNLTEESTGVRFNPSLGMDAVQQKQNLEEREITQLAEKISNSLDDLDVSYEVLFNRVLSVIGPEGPQDGESDPTPEVRSGLGNTLNEVHYRVRRISAMLRELESRIEL